jgi:hypothetical protein
MDILKVADERVFHGAESLCQYSFFLSILPGDIRT